jgi:hypothetical protein
MTELSAPAPNHRAVIEASPADLTARFSARRCCRCGEPAQAVRAGSDAVRQSGILLVRARQDQNSCLACLLVEEAT